MEILILVSLYECYYAAGIAKQILDLGNFILGVSVLTPKPGNRLDAKIVVTANVNKGMTTKNLVRSIHEIPGVNSMDIFSVKCVIPQLNS